MNRPSEETLNHRLMELRAKERAELIALGAIPCPICDKISCQHSPYEREEFRAKSKHE